MKKSYLLFVFVLCTLAACERQQAEPSVQYEDMVLRADFHTTRTVLQGGGHVFWSPEEEIAVFRSYSRDNVEGPGVRFVSRNTEPQAAVEFYGRMPVEGREGMSDKYGSVSVDLFPFWALYPYDPDATFGYNAVRTTLPLEQKAVPGTFAKGLFMAVARSMTTELSFFQPLGGLKFSVVSDDIVKVSMQAADKRALAGPVTLYTDSAYSSDEYNSDYSTVGLTPEDGGSFIPGESYYFVTVPRMLSTGFSLVFERADGKSVTRTVETGVQFKSGDFRTLMEADKGLQWEDTTVEITPESIDVQAFDGIETVFIKSVSDYEVSIDADWIQEVEIEGTTGGDARFEGRTHGFFICANFGEARTGHINFTVGETVYPVTVNQASGSCLMQVTRHHLGIINCSIDHYSPSWEYGPFQTVVDELGQDTFDFVAGFHGENGSSHLLGGKELFWSYNGSMWGVVDGRRPINNSVSDSSTADTILSYVEETDAYYTPLTSLGLSSTFDADAMTLTVDVDFYAAKAGTYKLTGLLVDNYVYSDTGLSSERFTRVVTSVLPDYKGEEVVFESDNTTKQLQYVFAVPSEYNGQGGRWGELEEYYIVFYTRASYDGHLRLGCAESSWYIDNSRRSAFGETLAVGD